MADTSPRTAARVDRRFGRKHAAELAAAGVLLALMVVMFSFVKPQAEPEADTMAEWEYYADFSEDMPQISTLIYGRQTSGSRNGVDSMSCVMKCFLVYRRLEKVLCTQMIVLD